MSLLPCSSIFPSTPTPGNNLVVSQVLSAAEIADTPSIPGMPLPTLQHGNTPHGLQDGTVTNANLVFPAGQEIQENQFEPLVISVVT
jgi:hypothetical protein